MFAIIEGAVIVTKCRGIYRQGKMYERGGRIFAQWSSGYITISKAAGRLSTSIPDVLVDEIEGLDDYKFTKTGAMVRKDFVETVQTAEEVNAIIHGRKRA